MANNNDNVIVMLGAVLIAQYTSVLSAESDDSDEDYDIPDTPSSSYRPPIAYEKRNWSLADAGWGDTECLEYLRFSQVEITELIRHLGLAEWVDDTVKMPGGYSRCAEQGFCMLLYRLASPGRLKDMIQVFGVSRSQISCVVNDLARFLHERFYRKLLWDHQRLSLEQLRRYVQAIKDTKLWTNNYYYIGMYTLSTRL